MLIRTRRIALIALAVAALAAPSALALPNDPTRDARGEYSASLPSTVPDDLRTENTKEPAPPVVVEVDRLGSGFDWSAAIIGAAGGLAIVLIGGAAVSAARHRPARPRLG